MTLTTLADRITALSSTCKEWQDRADELGRFATRRDHLREISDLVTELAAASDVLSQESSLKTRLRPVKAEAQTLRVRVDDLVQRLASSSKSILKPKALELFEGGVLEEIEKGLNGTWQDFLGTGDRPGIENVLSNFAALRDVATRIGQLRRRLQTLAETLPITVKMLEDGRRVKRDLAAELNSLTGSGLTDDVVTFLRRSVEGVPLSDLLASEGVLNWLRQHSLTEYFRVRSS